MKTTVRPTANLAISDETRTLMSGDAAPTSTWVQIAMAGTWKGHGAGEFTFDAETYSQMQANFAAQKNPIPVDFEHAAEMGPDVGNIAQMGAPAQAWITELRTVDDRLEALFNWVAGQPGIKYVREGAYRFTSPAVAFNASDRKSGKPIGPALLSVALTNRPFLDGMRKVLSTAHTAKAEAPMSDEKTTTPDKIAEGVVALAAQQAELSALRSTARLHALTCKQLGLAETASEGEIAAKLTAITALAAKASTLETEITSLRADATKRAEADAAADVDAVLASGKYEGLEREPLLSMRMSAPEAFARSFKVALDAKRMGDTHALTSRITTDSTKTSSTVGKAGPSIDEQIDALAEKLVKDEKLSLTDAHREATNRLLRL